MNNRDHNRVPLEVEVSMVSESNFWTGLTDNISKGGVFVATHQPPPVGSEVEIELKLPTSATSFVVRAVVRWVRTFAQCSDGFPPGCGLQFQSLSEIELFSIQEFVEERETLFYEDAA
jgi:uncharacterized protein (TIGR02266 family)